MDFNAQMEIARALWSAGKFADAAEAFRKASELSPADPIARANYGIALAKAGDAERALPVLEKIAAEVKVIPDLFLNLGNVYRLLLRLDDAVKAFSRAVELKPDFADAHWNRSLTLLLAGNFSQGWKGFEWRFRLPGRKPLPFTGQAWNGSLEALRGKTLILGAEQGFGDTIQFARYIPILADAGARVMLICQPEVKSLLSGIRGLSHIMSPPGMVPQFDLHAPLMSLGGLMKTDLHNIPANVPYLSAQPSNRLAKFVGTKKIGVVWAGRPTHTNDANRSIALNEFAPLANLPNVTLVSLQKGPAVEQIKSAAMKIVELGSELKDFFDTAALIAELDLLISVDTSVVHLAGALGKPVYTLLPYIPDWRWLLNRDDSPWYPTMKLFRQPQPKQWTAVIEKLCPLV